MAYQQVTLAELRSQLQAKFESVPFFTDIECNLAINESMQWYNLYTGVWKTRAVMLTVADQVYYTLPGTLVFNARMEFNTKPLNNSGLDDLDNGKPGWEAQTTATEGVPDAPEVWSPVGLAQFAIWPADHDGDNSLTIDGVHATPILTADTDYIDIDEGDIDSLLGEALALLCFKDPGRLPRVQAWHQEFIHTVTQRNGRLVAANAFRSALGLDLSRQTTPLVKKMAPQ